MPAGTQEVFARYPTMEREAALRMFVENSLGERGVRDLPELVEEIFQYRLDNSERVDGITHETLVIAGGADVVVDPRNADVLGELIPKARVELVPDRGHLLIWEDSERVAELVTEFLS